MVLQDPTLVLNRNWEPLEFTTVLDALCKVYAGSARAMKPDDYSLHDFDSWASLRVAAETPCVRTATLSIPVPEIIVLARYGKVPDRGVAFSRGNLYKRDRYTCQYCGCKPGTAELTIDHLVPRSRGGTSTWTNCVVACIRCNSKKADKTLAQAGLVLRVKPAKPTLSPRLVLARVPYRSSWEKFVSDVYWNAELKA
ncbi:MAG TPA: HNH endonuclease [Planctomycetota bacterium]|jgi:5-methylcytosine-specific restriction endonuclease McrA